MTGSEPAVALRRIAFLLERSQSPTYRVKAFRGAAAAIAGKSVDELAEMVTAGTLKTIPGIGPKTATVITQALSGRIPDYLADLEAKAGALTEGGQELRGLLRGDLHTHSNWSDGGSPILEMALAAADLGHEYLALTDHSPRLTVANGLSPARLGQQLDVVTKINTQVTGFRLLPGIECDINEDGSLDQTDEMLDRLDIVVASVHSKLRSAKAVMTERMLAAVCNPRVNILGHCTGRLVAQGADTSRPARRPESEFDAAAVFAACAENGVAVEINSRPERLDPPRRLLRQAIEAGCLFSIDTDAHAPGQLDWQIYGCQRAEECGVPADLVINTWPLPDLLSWSRRHRSP